MTQNKVLGFEEFCQKQQREMKCIFPSSEDCFKCEIRQKNREIKELKKKLDEAVDVIKFCDNNQSLFLIWGKIKEFLKGMSYET